MRANSEAQQCVREAGSAPVVGPWSKPSRYGVGRSTSATRRNPPHWAQTAGVDVWCRTAFFSFSLAVV